MKARSALLVGLVAAGVGLVGAGTSAALAGCRWPSDHSAGVRVSGVGTVSNDGQSLTLPDYGPTPSTYTTGPRRLVISNVSHHAVWTVRLAVWTDATSGAASAKLRDEMWIRICIGHSGTTTLFNGPLSRLLVHPLALIGYLAPGSSTDVAITLYNGLGAAPTLDNPAQGGVVSTTISLDYVSS